jgi:hypothetical protein
MERLVGRAIQPAADFESASSFTHRSLLEASSALSQGTATVGERIDAKKLVRR